MYVYKQLQINSFDWTFVQKLTAFDAIANTGDFFGCSVALYNTTAMIGDDAKYIDGSANTGRYFILTLYKH